MVELQQVEDQNILRYNVFHDISNEWFLFLQSDIAQYFCFDRVMPMSVFNSWLKGYREAKKVIHEPYLEDEMICTANRLGNLMYDRLIEMISLKKILTLFPVRCELTRNGLIEALLYERQKALNQPCKYHGSFRRQ